MAKHGDIQVGSVRISRLWQHVLFWTVAYFIMIVIYGYSKTTYWMAARNNLIYGPVQVIYFYILAYWLVPKFLMKQKYLQFFFLLAVVFIGAIYFTRIVDVAFVDPYNIRILGESSVWYPSEATTFWDKVVSRYYFFGALKGVNLIVWIALAIKLFKQLMERRNAALQAELNFLKSQIHPHFLFNTLNSLYALTLIKSDQSPDVVLRLSELMRYMLYECNTERSLLLKELRILKDYIELEKVRYEDRLDFSFSINGEISDQQIAPLLLLPFVENAFKHGAGERPGDVWISVDLQVQRNKIKYKVSNSKPESDDEPVNPGHLGLANLKKRLELLYPGAYELRFIDEEAMYLAVLELDLAKGVRL